MKKILLILSLLPFIASAQNGKDKFGKYVFMDSVYFKVVPYNSGAGIVALGIDTVASSPTFGKLVRKTASGGTANLSWDAANHQVDISGGGTSATIPLATTGTDGLISSASQSIDGTKFWANYQQFENGASFAENAIGSTAPAGHVWIYAKTDGLFYGRDDAGVETKLSNDAGSSGITVGTTTITSGTDTRVLYNNAGVVGEYALGSGISTWWATPSSANLASAVTNETGTGALMFGTSPQITTGIKDANGNDMILFTATTTAVNQFTFENATAANTPTIYATGTANVNFGFSAKGTGDFAFYGTTAEQAMLNIFEDRDNGLDFISITVPASISGNPITTLPNASSTLPIYPQQMTYTGMTAARTVTYPDENFTATGIASTQTLTNKRITKRTGTVASSATPTINTDNVDLFTITAQTVDITSMTTNLSGTPNDGDEIEIWITGTASRAITWGASFAASAIALPTTTSGTSTLRTKFIRSGSTWVIKGQY